MKKRLVIATRKSKLALWQARWVQEKIQAVHPKVEIELLEMTTRGDEVIDRPLANIGGKGLFIKELEMALMSGEADIAVHSMKDVPMLLPHGLVLSAIGKRANATDAFVSPYYSNIDEMPAGSRIGTSSARRRAILQYYYPRLEVCDVRGNVQTRLGKCDDGDVDALILATAGLERLGLHSRIRQSLPVSPWLPAPGQGAIGVESRVGDSEVLALMDCINDEATADCVLAERAVSRTLEGGCAIPLAAYATLHEGNVCLAAWVASPDGKQLLKHEVVGSRNKANELGVAVANNLKEQGADAWLGKY